MPVSTTNAISGPFLTNGQTSAFPFTFTAPSAAEVQVLSRNIATGVETVITGGFTVTLTPGGGGWVVFDTPPATGAELYLRLNPKFTQDIEFSDGAKVNLPSLHAMADQSVARDQFLLEMANRAVKTRVGTVAPAFTTIPNPVEGDVIQVKGPNEIGIVPLAQSTLAQKAAEAEAAAAVAAAAAGTLYLSIAAGLAATPNGKEFAVDNGDGTASIYLNNAGVAVLRRTIIIDPSAPSSASLLGFIQSGANARAETVQTALRREVWADQYKLTGDADDRQCIIRAVNAVLGATGGGVVRLSRRHYVLGSGIVFTNLNNVRIVGAGANANGTLIREAFTNGDAITFSNCQGCEISEVAFWPTVRKTGGFSVVLTGGCYDCRVDIRSDYGFNGLRINGATETRYRLQTRHMLGVLGALFTGTNTSRSYRCIVEDHIGDNPYPAGDVSPANFKTFTSGMSLSVGDHFIADGKIWQCVQAGQAGSSPPSGLPPGTSPESAFTTNVTNGSAVLRFVSNSSFAHLVQDNYAYSLVILAAALINGARGFVMQDTANTGTSYPIWAFALDLECDHNYTVGVDLNRGEGFYAPGAVWIGSCVTGNGVVIGPNFRGCVSFGSGTRIMGNAEHGILRQAGPTDVRLTGVEVTDNSVKQSAIYHGLTLAANSAETHVVGGRFGDSPSVSGNNQGYGISVNNGCDKTTIVGADVRGNVTGGINLGSSQTNLMIRDCPGYNAAGPVSITVGASPFSYTNTTGADVLVRVSGGTVSDISMDGATIATATNGQFLVPAGATLVVTYSAAPTMTRRVL